MTDKEYIERKNEIDKRYRDEINDLRKEYIKSKAVYGKGAVISDIHGHTGRVVSLEMFTYGGGLPDFYYLCENLTKKGTVNKTQSTVVIYPEHIKEEK